MDINYSNIEALRSTSTTESRITGSMSEANIKAVVREVGRVKNINKTTNNVTEIDTDKALALIAGLCQAGGTNRSAGGNVQYNLGTIQLTAVEFQKICQEFGGRGTARQFARTLCNEIHRIAEIFGIEGDLARQMLLDVPTMTTDMKIWCSNFQSENPSCPEEVRNWLKEDRKRRFRN